ncbi:hypothetical protein MMC34_007035 [Xylographa carneopallida]|nr:hypothetical protein [Xylographa carneopallida]
MASLRRSTVMPNDSATSRFLYTILKQLDHKSVVHPGKSRGYATDIHQIDWNTVASDLEITNGHAARMRFSRFKQHMEGVPPTSRKPRSEARQNKKAKTEKNTKTVGKRAKAENAAMKSESMDHQPLANIQGQAANEVSAKEEPFFKPDPFPELGTLIKPEPSVKTEPLVKEEPMDDWLYTVDEAEPSISVHDSFGLTNSPPTQAQQAVITPSTISEVLSIPIQASESPPVLKLEPHESLSLKLEPMDEF